MKPRFSHLKIDRTDSSNTDFQQLVVHLDQDLRIRDGEDHAFFAQFNKIDQIKHVLVAYVDDVAVGCGAIKHYGDSIVEIKRMFVLPEYRKQGIASSILFQLEQWAYELGYKKCILETGKKQPEAIALYQNCHYQMIPNFGQYIGVENSVCFEKSLDD
ncbi:MAG: GNAT family N-acetyltransferase [Flavobacteriales bacterium]|nr:GNAT family N-acetyltransferase [Flavobacteriales bacterium]